MSGTPENAAIGATLSIAGPETSREDILGHVGELTAQLHAALRELGYYPDVESAVQALPDARARLDYVAELTGNAAGRVLASAEQAWEVQKRLDTETTRIVERIQSGEDLEELRHVLETYAETVAESVIETNAHLFDIMLAQDFHDLSGQTLQRIVMLARELEDKLSRLLPGGIAPAVRVAGIPAGLSGPVHNPGERVDVVAGQAQVDSLLDSLGF